MNKKEKLLYIMGIDWNWIFQRPQIIEQHLEEKYDVTVVFPRSILHWKRKPTRKYPDNYKILWTIPWQEKSRFIGWISGLWSRDVFRNIQDYDVVVLGYPLYYRYVPETYSGKIIYDCMDNHEALYPDRARVDKVLQQEAQLVLRCNSLLVTADKLKDKMITIYEANPQKVYLVRNGVFVTKILSPLRPRKCEKYKIGYFGTIAAWFDYEVLEESLKSYLDIEYHLIGPVHKANETNHERIIMTGIVEHQKLPEVTEDYSCFVMPFVVNDIVAWVDPVKLYEYIALGRCIVSVYYPEIERFRDYVYMYSDSKDYVALLGELKEKGFPPKYNAEQQKRFLLENSWQKRFEQIDKIMNLERG